MSSTLPTIDPDTESADANEALLRHATRLMIKALAMPCEGETARTKYMLFQKARQMLDAWLQLNMDLMAYIPGSGGGGIPLVPRHLVGQYAPVGTRDMIGDLIGDPEPPAGDGHS